MAGGEIKVMLRQYQEENTAEIGDEERTSGEETNPLIEHPAMKQWMKQTAEEGTTTGEEPAIEDEGTPNKS